MSELELASPLTLLEESEPVGEALFLSYGAQLGFFERSGLAAARSLGARVSVVADASRVSVDVDAVRRAGLRYLDGRVDLPGRAFHPKLVVLAGANGATVAIGSANLTLGGWHGNAEIWTVLRVRLGQGPRAIGAVADFLTELPAVVSVGPGVERALLASAEQLAALAPRDEGPLLVHSLAEPILGQLPTGPVDELHLYAPFFDSELKALTAICDRFDPRRFTVYIHPETSVDGPALEGFLKARRGSWLSIKDRDRYHHGKLIEWVVDGRRFALTGSPNLSTPALLKSASEGGNIELGLIGELKESLAPETSTEPARPLVEHRIIRDRIPTPSFLVLGAVVEQDGIRIVLGRPLAEEARVEIHQNGGWLAVDTILKGIVEVVVAYEPHAYLAGSALRLRDPYGESSNVVFVTDLDSVRRTQIERTGETRTNPTEIFSSYAIARAFAEDLARLRVALTTGRSGGEGGSDGKPGGPSPDKLTAEEYLERCDAGVGEAMARFGFGLPVLLGTGTASPVGDPGEGGDPDPDIEEKNRARRSIQDLSASTRRRYKAWFGRLFILVPELPLAGRLIVANLMVTAAADGLWDEPREWLGRYAETICALFEVAPDSKVDEEARQVAALLALLILDSHVERYVGNDPARHGFDLVASELKETLSGSLDLDAFELKATDVLSSFGHNVYPGDTAEMLERVGSPPNDLERAVNALAADFEISARVDDGQLVLEGIERPERGPLLVALACTESDGRVVASITAKTGKITAVWEKPNLLILRDTPRGLGGDVYFLPNGLSLPTSRSSSYELPKAHCEWMPREQIPAAAARLLRR